MAPHDATVRAPSTAHGTAHHLAVDPPPPRRGVVALAWVVAVWCVGFAAVNIAFETTGRFADGPYAEYATGLAVMNWLVVGLKVIGAAIALLAVSRRSWRRPTVLAVLLWGACATLGLDAIGSVVTAVGLATGLTGDPSEITAAGIVYVVFFLLGAVGYGVLSTAFSRRFGTGRWPVLLGVLGAPVVLAVIFVVLPALLTALGIMPAQSGG